MSTFIKFLLMALAWGLLWAVSYYGCVKPEYCPDDAVAVTAPATPAPVAPEKYAIVSTLGSNEVLTGELWDSELQGLLTKYKSDPGQALEITGKYYASETAPAGFENMGLYRADEIKRIMVAQGVPADNIRLLSAVIRGAAPASDKRFDAGDFSWGRMAEAGAPETAELVEVAEDEVKIRFPFNKSTRDLGAQIEGYLKTLATRIQQSKETVVITGHTDNVDTDAFNQRLGKQRADFVKARLVRYGAPANLITTSSRGESSPEASNGTAEGRRLNRRAVVKLNRAQ